MSKFYNYKKELNLQKKSNLQSDVYFDKITKTKGLENLSGKQIAQIARLMAEQKEYGFNECYIEFR